MRDLASDALAAAVTYFEALYPASSPEAAPAYLAILNAEPGVKSGAMPSKHLLTTDARALAAESIRLSDAGLNVYNTICAHGSDLGWNHRGTRAQVTLLPALWADIDLAGPGHAAGNLPASVDDAVRHLLIPFGQRDFDSDIEPSMVIHSGGGLHAYWLLARPEVVTDANRGELQGLLRAWSAKLKALAEARGWHFDNVSDLTRVLRPPGTLNRKPGRPEHPAVSFLLKDGPRYDLSALRAHVGAFPTVDAPIVPSGPTPSPSAPASIWTYEATEAEVRGKIRKNRKVERAETFKAILAGEPFARPGERDQMLQRVASWLAFYCPEGDPEAIADILAPSLEAMRLQSPDDHLTLDQAVDKIVRAQGDGRRQNDVRKAADERMRGALIRESRKQFEPAPKVLGGKDSIGAPNQLPPGLVPPSAERADTAVESGVGVVPLVLSAATVPPTEGGIDRNYVNPLAVLGITALTVIPPGGAVNQDRENAKLGYYTLDEIGSFVASQERLSGLAIPGGTDGFKKRWIIQRGDSFYVYRATNDPHAKEPGAYCTPIQRTELEVSLERDLRCVPETIPLADQPSETEPYFSRWVAKADGGLRRKTSNEVLAELATVAREVIIDLRASCSYYDPATETFYEATCPLRHIEPAYCREIERWLERLGGAELDKLLDWLATITDLTRPSCALFLSGKTSAGKSMLASGLARLWTLGGPTKMKDVGSAFNADMARCPLLYADEEIPTVDGRPMSTKSLRELIADDRRPLRRKFMANATMVGCIRALFTSNNADMLSAGDESLGPDALEAVANRFLHVPIGHGAGDYLMQLGGAEYTHGNGWVDGDKIAAHVLWLKNTRKVEPGHRFLVEGRLSNVHELLSTTGTIPGLVVEWLVRFLAKPHEGLLRTKGIVLGGGVFLVNSPAMLEQWDHFIKNERAAPTLQKINKAIANISKSTDPLRRDIKTVKGIVERRRYWDLKPEIVLAWADQNAIGDTDLMKKLIEGPEAAFVPGSGLFGT